MLIKRQLIKLNLYEVLTAPSLYRSRSRKFDFSSALIWPVNDHCILQAGDFIRQKPI